MHGPRKGFIWANHLATNNRHISKPLLQLPEVERIQRRRWRRRRRRREGEPKEPFPFSFSSHMNDATWLVDMGWRGVLKNASPPLSPTFDVCNKEEEEEVRAPP